MILHVVDKVERRLGFAENEQACDSGQPKHHEAVVDAYYRQVTRPDDFAQHASSAGHTRCFRIGFSPPASGICRDW
jgi:hypothetical protein